MEGITVNVLNIIKKFLFFIHFMQQKIKLLSQQETFQKKEKIIKVVLLILAGFILFCLAKIHIMINELMIIWMIAITIYCLVDIISLLNSAWNLIKCLLINTLAIPIFLFYLINMINVSQVSLWTIILWPILWLLVSLIAEPESAKLANNFYITISTIVLTVCSIILSLGIQDNNNEIIGYIEYLKGISLVFLPFLSLSLTSIFLIQAKEYVVNKYYNKSL